MVRYGRKRSLLVIFTFTTCLATLSACSIWPFKRNSSDWQPALPSEKHFKKILQLTHDGINVKAYWSFNGKYLTYQHKDLGPNASKCDEIYRMRADGSDSQRVSSENGQNTCSYFFPDNSRILFSATLPPGTAGSCPKAPVHANKNDWPIRDSFQIYSVKVDGSDPIPLEPGAPRAYNAEATVCHDGSVVFTSDRSGDLELYTGKIDANFSTLTDVKQITHLLGYDGAAAFSPDCKKLVWRASRPEEGKQAADYKKLLARHLYRPTAMEIWTADADGSNAHPVTKLNVISFAPFFTPDGERIIFAANARDPKANQFDLYLIHTDGTGLERVTFSDTFEGFPMFSPNGKYLAFSSNRNANHPHETNVFVAEWIN
jgi:Tol biopolymer transport system component